MDQVLGDSGPRHAGLLGNLDVNADEDHDAFMKRIEEKKTEEYIEEKVLKGELPKASLLLPKDCLPLSKEEWDHIA